MFTTGGIGPTHDDITSECVAAAFGVPWEPHPVAWPRMESLPARRFQCGAAAHGDHAARRDADRERLSVAPGFQIGNVYVMAGVPRVMQSMFEWLAPRLQGGPKIQSRAVHAIGLPEGVIAEGLGAIQGDIRNRPRQLSVLPPERQRCGTGRQGTDVAAAEAAIAEVTILISGFGKVPIPGRPEG